MNRCVKDDSGFKTPCLLSHYASLSNRVFQFQLPRFALHLPRYASALVSLFSVCNCLGRLGGGVVSELGVYRGLPRPAFLAAAQLAVALGMGALAAFPTTAWWFVFYRTSCNSILTLGFEGAV